MSKKIIILIAIMIVSLGVLWYLLDYKHPLAPGMEVRRFTICQAGFECVNTDVLVISKVFTNCLETEKMVLCPGTDGFQIKQNQ